MSATIIQFPADRAARGPRLTSKAAGQRTHRCHADGCRAEAPLHCAFCAEHAAMLPAPLRRALWREFRPDFGAADTAQFVRWISAGERACDLIRRAERRLLPRVARA